MKNKIIAIAFFLLSLIITIILFNKTVITTPNNLTISAAISLKDALEEVKTLYSQTQPNIQINYNFGSSGSLQQQIIQGAPVDIFISAAKKQLDILETQNLILPETRINLLSNQLVLITSNNSKIQQIKDLTLPEIKRIALGEIKSVPVGEYAKQSLDYYQMFNQIKSKIVYAKDVRQVLNYVVTENVDAGFVYITDAKTSKQVKIVLILPDKSHKPIIYPMAIIKNTKNLQIAKDFSKFLQGNISKQIFKKYGFN